MAKMYAKLEWEVADIRNAMNCESTEPMWSDQEIEKWFESNEDKLHDVMLQAGWHYIYQDIEELKHSG